MDRNKNQQLSKICPRLENQGREMNTPGYKKLKILIGQQTGVQPILGSFGLLRVRDIY